MLLIIESSDEQVLQKITELIRPFKVAVRKEPSADTASVEERKRRVALVRKFKGGLKNRFSSYQPNKHDWYQQ
ncbi:MAG: hypothetical protein ACKVT2_19855 [Saprospiraceae bacterium]